MKKRKKRNQITCLCGAYSFPHRIGGGDCNSTKWAASYKNNLGNECQGCNCMNNGESGAQGERSGTCDVVEGLEDIKEGECYQQLLHSHSPIRLPASAEYLFKKAQEDYYE